MTGQDTVHTSNEAGRGLSPVVGIVLLFAMVVLGAALVFIAGTSMIDAFEAQADQERVDLFVDETDHQLMTVAASGQDQELPIDEVDGDVRVVDDGHVNVTWHGGNIDVTADDDLGALEFELEDRTIAHQGGGIWEDTGDTVRADSEPQIGYDGESGTLELRILQLDEDVTDGGTTMARADHTVDGSLSDEINDAAERSDGENVTLSLNSSYHEGWYQFLTDALGEDDHDEVTVEHEPSDERVVATITEIRDTTTQPKLYVEEDLGPDGGEDIGDYQLEYGEPMQFEAALTNAAGDTFESPVMNVSIEDGPAGEGGDPLSAEGTKNRTVSVTDAKDELDPGYTYEYTISTLDDAGHKLDTLDEPGSFYLGKPDTNFNLSNTDSTVDDDYVTITADLHNIGLEDGSQELDLDLEYEEELEGDPYDDIELEEITRSYGENGTIEVPINQSVLLDGEYEATIDTEDDEATTSFEVSAGVDPGRVGLGEIEDANVSVQVLGSQVSGDGTIGGFPNPTPVHNLAPMSLDVVANDETEYSFTNPDGGSNLNTGPTWQDKSDDSFTYNFTIEDETELTLRNTRYSTCQSRTTDPAELSHYSGPTDRDFTWCTDTPWNSVFGPIDASQDQNLQNVRVRSAEDNTIPALPSGTDQQLSATEVLEEAGLVEPGEDELDLGSGEFVFLFENTIDCSQVGCDQNDIDALWNDAIDAYEQNPTDTYDPNFNDLIVYVDVERAGVDPDTPSITIDPGAGDSVSEGPGESDASDLDGSTGHSGVDADTDQIVIG
ncbi:DUF7289 family protein [Natrarchaeobaculum sulfurireducens]|uniref:Flagellin N-terminal-like domain-containing protein n=1 Tax=Natrarchaeobaculum sulfurireducens TaxID=2044521 RepID=A0A346PL17_9EURY|nr:archaellin/type IV pilin N-terminal domain-containing protein [Natrarchaeobaculum sulfurireducens]AXR80212.1 hypothetical protein AArcMg_0189 [Natrarchaeobaculum sulfurireducens]